MLTVLQGHTLEKLRELPSASVHTVVTSPPYWGLRDYGTAPVEWPACDYIPMAGLAPVSIPAMTASLGLEPTLEAFIAHLVLIFQEIKRILHPTGTLWLNMGDGYAQAPGQHRAGDAIGPKQATNAGSDLTRPLPGTLKPKDLQGQPWRLAFALQAAGWYLRSDIIWAKPNPMPESTADRPTKAHEYLFLLTPNKKYFYDAEAVKEVATGDPSRRNRFDTKDYAVPGQKPQKRTSRHSPTPRHAHLVTNNIHLNEAPRGGTRNKRTIWTVALQAYKGAHFATFPEKLIEPCILAGTSAKGCCPHCLAPWERIIKIPSSKHAPKRAATSKGEGVPDPRNYKTSAGQKWQECRAANPTLQLGWRPTCQCPAADPIPCTVLDPFLGSGTTARVALIHRRAAIGIELNEAYLPLIRQRTQILHPAKPKAARKPGRLTETPLLPIAL